MAGLLLIGCGKTESQSALKATNSNPSSGSPLSAPADYLGAAAKAKTSATILADTVGVKQAIGQFFALEGKFPTNLNELVARKYLPSIPEPPPGKKFYYNPATGDVKIE